MNPAMNSTAVADDLRPMLRIAIDWYFTEVSKLTDQVGVAEAELLAAQSEGAH